MSDLVRSSVCGDRTKCSDEAELGADFGLFSRVAEGGERAWLWERGEGRQLCLLLRHVVDDQERRKSSGRSGDESGDSKMSHLVYRVVCVVVLSGF